MNVCFSQQNLSKDTKLKASNGKEIPALHVFSLALKFFKEHALKELNDQSVHRIVTEDIRWVITVPAIWKAPAKHFMRQAAYQVKKIILKAPKSIDIMFLYLLKVYQTFNNFFMLTHFESSCELITFLIVKGCIILM